MLKVNSKKLQLITVGYVPKADAYASILDCKVNLLPARCLGLPLDHHIGQRICGILSLKCSISIVGVEGAPSIKSW